MLDKEDVNYHNAMQIMNHWNYGFCLLLLLDIDIDPIYDLGVNWTVVHACMQAPVSKYRETNPYILL